MIHCSAVRLNNSDLRQRVTEVGVACPRSLARVDDLAAGVADVIDAAVFADSVPAGVIAEADHWKHRGGTSASAGVRAANCSSICRHWSGFDRRNCNWWYRREWHKLTMAFPCDWITALFFFGKTALFYISEPNKSTGAKGILERLFQRFPQEG